MVCYCWKAEMVKHGRIMCVIVRCVIFPMWMAKLIHLWQLFMPNFVVCCVGNLHGLLSFWCVINVQGINIQDTLHRPWTRYRSRNGFVLYAFNKPKTLFLQLDSQKYLWIFSKVIHIWLSIWGTTIKQLTMGFTFAPTLLILALYNQGGHFWRNFQIKLIYYCMVQDDLTPNRGMVC